MANRFEFLVPDIAGSYQQGRAQVRQEQRERLADQELRSQLDRGNRLRQLAPREYTAAAPAEQQRYLEEVASINPQAAAETQKRFQAQEERKQTLRANTARMLMAVPQAARANVYRQIVPQFRQAGLDAPDEYTSEMDAMMQAYAAQQAGQTPARVAGFEGLTQGMSAADIESARRIELGLEGRAASGGMSPQKITGPDGREYFVVFDPRTGSARPVSMQELFGSGGPAPASPPQSGAPPAPGGVSAPPLGGAPMAGLTPAEKVAQEAEAKARVELATAPQIASATTLAEQQAKNQAERQKSQQQNQTAFHVYTQARNNLQQAMAGTTTGPLAGRIPAVTASQQIAEGAGATMAPVLKNLFRDAGEGTFTEGDQKLLTDMLPKRTDHPEVVTAKLEMIDRIIAAKLGASPVSQPPRQQQATSQPQGPIGISNDADYASLPSGTQYRAPDGSIRTKR